MIYFSSAKRYLHLYKYFLKFSISRTLEFRVDFFFRVFMDIGYFTINLLFFKILFLHSGIIGGWDEPQIMLFTGAIIFADAINMTVFANNIWEFPQLINKGDLDYYLTRPVSSLFFISLRSFAANSFVNLICSLCILIYFLSSYPQPLAPLNIILFFIFLIIGACFKYMIHMIVLLPIFWIQSGSSLHEIYYSLARYGERPDRIYPQWIHRTLTSIIPFCLIASYPTRILLGENSLSTAGYSCIIAILFFVILQWTWRRGLQAYSSASS